MEFHQVLVGASPGDAITRSAFQLRSVLRQFGPSEMFAAHVDPRISHEVGKLWELPYRSASSRTADVLLLHVSIGEPGLMEWIDARPERIVVVYHNITPAKYFAEYNATFATFLEKGRHDLIWLKDRAVLAVADSEFNAQELRDLGYTNVAVVPLLLDFTGLRNEEPDSQTLAAVEAMRGPVILFVGQILPHKRPDLLLEAFHVMSTYLDDDPHLIVVGPNRLQPYWDAVQDFASSLNLPNAWITGPVSDAELVAFFRGADVFAMPSEHEGFCVPLVESMHFGVPIVARANAAIPDTVGDAALLVPGDAGPLLFAEALHRAIHDEPLRETLRERGYARLRQYEPEVAKRALLEQLQAVA